MTNRTVITAILLLLLGIAGFWLGVFVSLRIGPGAPSADPQLMIQFIDVGDGDASFVRSPRGFSMLIDGGPDQSGASTVIAQIRRLQSAAPQVIVAASPRPRSIGGLPFLLDHLNFHGILVLPCDAKTFAQSGGVPAVEILSEAVRQKAQVWTWPEFQSNEPQLVANDPSLRLILIPVGPAAASGRLPAVGDKTTALAVRIEHGRLDVPNRVFFSSAFLDTAGLSPAEESELVAENPHLACDVLAATDGGGAQSLSYEFLALAAPRLAVISTAQDDPPDEQVLARLHAAAAQTERTDQVSTITIGLDPDPNAPITYYAPRAPLPGS